MSTWSAVGDGPVSADLATAFGFSDADLEHNRLGDLSPMQARTTPPENRGSKDKFFGFAMLCVVVAIGLVLPAVFEGTDGKIVWLGGAAAALGAAAVFAFVSSIGMPKARDRAVLVAEGRAQFVEADDGGGDMLLVDGITFDVTRTQLEAVDEGHLYRVYHLLEPDLVLSVEYVSPPPG